MGILATSDQKFVFNDFLKPKEGSREVTQVSQYKRYKENKQELTNMGIGRMLID